MAGTVEIERVQKAGAGRKPSQSQLRYLRRGLDEAGGKLPLFDTDGQRINQQTIRSCMKKGWCEPWARNPVKPDWLVCKLTKAGRAAAERR